MPQLCLMEEQTVLRAHSDDLVRMLIVQIATRNWTVVGLCPDRLSSLDWKARQQWVDESMAQVSQLLRARGFLNSRTYT